MTVDLQNITWHLGTGIAGAPHLSPAVSKTITFGRKDKIVTVEFPSISFRRPSKKRKIGKRPPISDTDSKVSRKVNKSLFITNLRKT